MNRLLLVIAALILSASSAFAAAKTQRFTAGWDYFGEPLNYKMSNVVWSVNPITKQLIVRFALVGATPNKLYMVALNIFCTTFPATFGQFPSNTGGGTCMSATRQNVTATIAQFGVGTVTTDIHGNGNFRVEIGPVPSGTYQLEFYVYDGAYCAALIGEGCSDCNVDFQSPGPFGTATTITMP